MNSQHAVSHITPFSATSALDRLKDDIDDLKMKISNDSDFRSPEEWRTTPNLENYLETNGRGQFRNPMTLEVIEPKRPYKKRNRARIHRYTDENGERQTISLQKFVALIYHPNPYNATMTVVLDGDRDNLRKDNLDWYYIGGYKY